MRMQPLWQQSASSTLKQRRPSAIRLTELLHSFWRKMEGDHVKITACAAGVHHILPAHLRILSRSLLKACSSTCEMHFPVSADKSSWCREAEVEELLAERTLLRKEVAGHQEHHTKAQQHFKVSQILLCFNVCSCNSMTVFDGNMCRQAGATSFRTFLIPSLSTGTPSRPPNQFCGVLFKLEWDKLLPGLL